MGFILLKALNEDLSWTAYSVEMFLKLCGRQDFIMKGFYRLSVSIIHLALMVLLCQEKNQHLCVIIPYLFLMHGYVRRYGFC